LLARHLSPADLKLATIVSGILFFLYMYDKHLARAEAGHRVPESILLSIAFLGGWAGGVAAMFVFNHKTSKQPYVLL
jgi:uncharacterized membrane protein YsdA (DUF1294 family)